MADVLAIILHYPNFFAKELPAIAPLQLFQLIAHAVRMRSEHNKAVAEVIGEEHKLFPV